MIAHVATHGSLPVQKAGAIPWGAGGVRSHVTTHVEQQMSEVSSMLSLIKLKARFMALSESLILGHSQIFY